MSSIAVVTANAFESGFTWTYDRLCWTTICWGQKTEHQGSKAKNQFVSESASVCLKRVRFLYLFAFCHTTSSNWEIVLLKKILLGIYVHLLSSEKTLLFRNVTYLRVLHAVLLIVSPRRSRNQQASTTK